MNALAGHSAALAAGGRDGQPSGIFAHAKKTPDHADTAGHVRRDDPLRARKRAAGQGGARVSPPRRGRGRAGQWGYREVPERRPVAVVSLPGGRGPAVL